MTMLGKRSLYQSSRRGAVARKVWAAPQRCFSGDELANARWFLNRRRIRPSQIARHSGRPWTPMRLVFGRKHKP